MVEYNKQYRLIVEYFRQYRLMVEYKAMPFGG